MTIKVYIIDSMFFEYSNIQMIDGEYSLTSQEFISTVDFSELSILEDEIKSSFKNLKDDQLNVEIHLIDKNNRIKYYYTDEGKEQFNIFSKNIKNNIFIHSCDWEDYNKNMVYLDEDEYIFSTTKTFRNKYEFALNIDGLFHINRFYIHDMKSLLDICNINKCKSPLNIYVNLNKDKIYNMYTSRDDLQEIDNEAISWLLINGIEHCKNCVIAGFLKKERFVQNRVPSWTLNVESFYMKGVIYHEKLFPKVLFFSSEDTSHGKTIQEKFLESADYRYKITIKMAEYLYFYCKFISNNEFTLSSMNQFNNINIYDEMLNIIK